MFITEDEARQRLENPRNIFSPSYVPPVPSATVPASEIASESDIKGSHISEDDSASTEDDSPSEDVDTDPSAHKALVNPSEIDKLLAGTVDPYAVRQRKKNLRGEVDVQVAIGASSYLLGPTTAGNLYDLAKSQAGAYQEGLSRSSDMKDKIDRVPERSRRLKSVKEQIAEKAAGRLSAALNSLTDEKIKDCSASRVSSIAKDMAVVMDKVTKDGQKAEAIHFHIFRPEMKTVEQYTTVQVSAPVIISSQGDGGSSS